MKESKVKEEKEEEEVEREVRNREKESALSACLVCIYIFSEPGLSALYPGFITDRVLSKDWKIPWMLSNLCPTTFCFLRPFFFAWSIFFFTQHIKGAGLVSEMVVLEKEGDRESIRDKTMSWRKLKTRQRERGNTKLLLLLTLKRPVSCTHSPSLPSPSSSSCFPSPTCLLWLG